MSDTSTPDSDLQTGLPSDRDQGFVSELYNNEDLNFDNNSPAAHYLLQRIGHTTVDIQIITLINTAMTLNDANAVRRFLNTKFTINDAPPAAIILRREMKKAGFKIEES
jgi:hypothetical protein